MIVEIHFTLPNGDEDYVTIEGETIPEIREKADHEVASRSGTNPWSKVVDE